jgi:hypothetical protein
MIATYLLSGGGAKERAEYDEQPHVGSGRCVCCFFEGMRVVILCVLMVCGSTFVMQMRLEDECAFCGPLRCFYTAARGKGPQLDHLRSRILHLGWMHACVQLAYRAGAAGAN